MMIVSWLVGLVALPATTFAEVEWINKDFKNTLQGVDTTRHDLHWFIGGQVKDAIVDIYVPSELPDEPEIIEETPVTQVRWSGGTIEPNDVVHCGIQVDWPGPIPEKRFAGTAHWSKKLAGEDWTLMERVAGCASLNLTAGEDAIDVEADNTADPNDPAMDICDFSFAFVGAPLPLAELTWNNPAIPWTSLPWCGTIPPAGDLFLGSIPRTTSDPYLIIQCSVNFSGDPPANAGHIIVQREVPLPDGIPTLSEWGLIVLTLLLLTAATVVLGRRRRPVAA